MFHRENLPVAVIGAGPVGLAAAAHLIERGMPVKLYETGGTAGANVRDWGHVRLFSPWSECIDSAARVILQRHGWRPPTATALPTGAEFYETYLKPLAATPELSAVMETGATVRAISRLGTDKVGSHGRETRPFTLTVTTANGTRRDLARAVIDASGTWTNPNPLGSEGLPADGELESADRIAYGIPAILGRDREIYQGRTTLVAGSGHSAANILLDLARLAQSGPGTRIIWATRGTDLRRVYGGGTADQLPARGALGSHLKDLVDTGQVDLVPGFRLTAVRRDGAALMIDGETTSGPQRIGPVDRIVVATGQRPDLEVTRELRLDLDPWLESVRSLGPMIDPNLHSCGSVPPHGHRELAHPEPGFYTAGIKSYGRAPTFLMLTGYEQVRSIAAALAGDIVAADSVQLVLPETGVCSSGPAPVPVGAGCSVGPVRAKVTACCLTNPAAEGRAGSGCGTR